ncbi:acyl-CoA dehydrogenase [Gemmobacter megaterium]|uniref:Acyl-CoA dehydrogenase n=1 Tax=Gemmobacter megaterium TaxID=1086013 RepID=A0A1N7MLH6_9RHOB|nr:acyl-CoA dehydrogenase family protein [Gemmobacter megaterium]GGE06102.1 acyl-CoA dehydrogenase [Gemmobacter megaterium]SIS87015.1 acyl-CoA dehydrogenase [Gemmobacter megaterium]
MIPEKSARVIDLSARLTAFMDEHIYPNEARYYREAEELGPFCTYPVMDELKPKARAAGLWNLFLPESDRGAGLTNVEYGHLCEIMGRSLLAPEVFNCNAPDTGNMEVLERYGTDEHKARWLRPLLAGEIRSCFAMTEPDVASSDATNIEAEIRRDGDDYVINAHKWYTTGASNPATKICIFMGKTDPANPDRHRQQSMILVPMDTPGITVTRSIPIFGYYGVPDRASEVLFENVRVPASNMLLGEGRGFEIAQGRLGPGRIHHCMRSIGLAERLLEGMCDRALQRVAFGKKVADQGVTRERIANARILIDQCRLLTLHAAHRMDTVGNKVAKAEIAMIKVAVPNMACQVADWAIQVFGGGGTGNDFGTAIAYAGARVLRLADGPDEVHRDQLARMELKKRQGRTHPGWTPLVTRLGRNPRLA